MSEREKSGTESAGAESEHKNVMRKREKQRDRQEGRMEVNSFNFAPL
jgi:hypothetical protein